MSIVLHKPGTRTSLLKQLHESGQAVWLDFVDRTFIKGGGLRKLVDEDGATGVTSNPSIFEKAMGHVDVYDEGFHASSARSTPASRTPMRAR